MKGNRTNWPVVPSSFSPIVHTEQTTNEYRFQVPGAGLFQCSDTGLVFGTTGEGEVLYRTVQWDERCLQSTGGTPAGPLFDIQCPQKSVRQLHLPHCAITPGDDLCVANITDGGVYLLKPQKVTQTHVVLNVTHLSLFGLLWKKNHEYLGVRPTSGRVLLFLQPPGRRTRKLSVLMLPDNMPVKEVKTFYQECNQKDQLVSNSNCVLTPDQVYRLQCASHEVQPEAVAYRVKYGPNFHPTFKVTMDVNAEVVSLALLGPENEQVWEEGIELEGSGPSQPDTSTMTTRQEAETEIVARVSEAVLKDAGSSQPNVTTTMTTRQEAETLLSVRKKFIQRVPEPVLDGLLDTLLDEKVLTDGEMDSVRVEKGGKDRARKLIDMVRKKGNEASSKMIAALHEEDPSLHQELGLNKP